MREYDPACVMRYRWYCGVGTLNPILMGPSPRPSWTPLSMGTPRRATSKHTCLHKQPTNSNSFQGSPAAVSYCLSGKTTDSFLSFLCKNEHQPKTTSGHISLYNLVSLTPRIALHLTPECYMLLCCSVRTHLFDLTMVKEKSPNCIHS